MQFSLSFWDISLWLAIISIILLITSEILNPRYGRTKVRIKGERLRNTALATSILFILTLAIGIIDKILNR